MSDYLSGTLAPDAAYGPVLLAPRGNIPPVPLGAEGALVPLNADADGRLRVAEGSPDDFDSTLYATAAANTAVVITLAAPAPDMAWEIRGLCYSYVGGTVAGSITVAKGSGPTTVLALDTAVTGPFLLLFPTPRRAQAAEQIVVTLAAGGAGVTGRLTLFGVRQVLAPGTSARPGGILDFQDPNQSGLA